ncbi:MAG: YggS family pyridoxal phosphate-dependent enzyme [Saezia sp.]
MLPISYHLQQIQGRIIQTCLAANRPANDVRLLAVSKTFGKDAIQEAIHAGQLAFGENYVAEGVSKIQHFNTTKPTLEWHMIGPIQSNKTKEVAQNFHWAHAIDRLKIAQRLSDQRPKSLPPLQICIAVNVSGEESKSGVTPEEVLALAQQIESLPHLRLRGLMCIPEPAQGLEQQRKPFALMRTLLQDLQNKGFHLDTLSMGMSDDMEAAILEGATLIRVGRGIFGDRHYPPVNQG